MLSFSHKIVIFFKYNVTVKTIKKFIFRMNLFCVKFYFININYIKNYNKYQISEEVDDI